MENETVPELWEWAEYYCSRCYVAAVRLHKVRPEYQGWVKLRQPVFPLEIYGGGPPDMMLHFWLGCYDDGTNFDTLNEAAPIDHKNYSTDAA